MLSNTGHRRDEQRHENNAQHSEDRDNKRQARKGIAGKFLRVLTAFQFFGKQRHKGDVKRPFGKEAAKQIGERKGDKERLGTRRIGLMSRAPIFAEKSYEFSRKFDASGHGPLYAQGNRFAQAFLQLLAARRIVVFLASHVFHIECINDLFAVGHDHC